MTGRDPAPLGAEQINAAGERTFTSEGAHAGVTDAIIVAAGRGERAGPGAPKQYRDLNGAPVLLHSLRNFLALPAIRRVVVVVRADDRALFDTAIAALDADYGGRLMSVSGGATRQASVRHGLEALASMATPPTDVLVHDAARPWVSASLIQRAITAARAHGAAVPGIAVSDTIKSVDAEGLVTATLPRPTLRAIQTPQAFRFSAILDAHRRAANAQGVEFTDDAAIAEWAGLPVHVFEGEPGNIKLTHQSDFGTAPASEATLAPATANLISRTGIGYDVHAFVPGDHIWLGGVRIASDLAVTAHSDGDVALHALTDALLGTIGDGDIGAHFPPSDPQWAGASSDRFLAHAAKLVRARSGVIDHVDVVIICEHPKVGPHRQAMRARIAEILGLSETAVSIKATTSERLGFTGRREGIAAQAVASVRLPLLT